MDFSPLVASSAVKATQKSDSILALLPHGFSVFCPQDMQCLRQQVLPSSYGGQIRPMTITQIDLGVSGIS